MVAGGFPDIAMGNEVLTVKVNIHTLRNWLCLGSDACSNFLQSLFLSKNVIVLSSCTGVLV